MYYWDKDGTLFAKNQFACACGWSGRSGYKCVVHSQRCNAAKANAAKVIVCESAGVELPIPEKVRKIKGNFSNHFPAWTSYGMAYIYHRCILCECRELFDQSIWANGHVCDFAEYNRRKMEFISEVVRKRGAIINMPCEEWFWKLLNKEKSRIISSGV